MRISGLQEKLERGDFVVTAEVCPPKGADCSAFLAKAASLSGIVDAINVTDNQGANMRICPLAASSLLVREGIEPILQITCRDRNRLALQSDLLGAAALGIRNILVLTGDHISFGDHPGAKPVFDMDSVQLLQAVRDLEQGRDSSGNSLKGCPAFYPGAAAAPEADPFGPTLVKLEKKAMAGARFFQTQALFLPEKLRQFRERTAHLGVKVIAGILLLKSAGMCRYVNSHIPGLHVPESSIEAMERSSDPVAGGLAIARNLVRQLRPHCDGLHIMAMGREDLIPEIVKELI